MSTAKSRRRFEEACCLRLLGLCNLRSITVTSHIVETCIISLSAFIFRVKDEGLPKYKKILALIMLIIAIN
jgi:hypothetical protein